MIGDMLKQGLDLLLRERRQLLFRPAQPVDQLGDVTN